METRLKSSEFDRIKYRCGFNSCLVVDCNGVGRERAGGLALMWNDESNISILSFSLNHICGSVADPNHNELWYLVACYGHPEEQHKKKTWDLIEHLVSQVGNKVICFGDFNDVVSAEDKSGGNPRTTSQLAIGRGVMSDCGLAEFGFEGYPFTWSNGREGEDNVQCRLDRAMGTEDFANRFSPIRVLHLPRYGSDHAAVLIHLEADPR
ncbi:hypothetical protein A2U01_0032678, partial [Trifolium medium]|nr:hypothetical protein [Trifolium medium]